MATNETKVPSTDQPLCERAKTKMVFAEKKKLVESVKALCLAPSVTGDGSVCYVCEKPFQEENIVIFGMAIDQLTPCSSITCSDACAITFPAFLRQNTPMIGQCGWCDRQIPKAGKSAVLLWTPKAGRCAFVHCCTHHCAEILVPYFEEGCSIISISTIPEKTNLAAIPPRPIAQSKRSSARQGKKTHKPMGEAGYCPACGAEGRAAFECKTCGTKSCSSACARQHYH